MLTNINNVNKNVNNIMLIEKYKKKLIYCYFKL